jgi:hypothetical protein
MRSKLAAMTIGFLILFSGGAHAAYTTVAGFDGGSNGGFQGNAFFEATGGNPGGVAHTPGLIEFPELRTGAIGEPSNPGFLGNYSGFTNVTFGVDVKTVSMEDFMGNQSSRPFGVMLIDRDIQGIDGPSGVYFQLGDLGVDFNPSWTTYSVTIANPASPTLPAGWIGFGSTNMQTYEPELPAGATFASVLAGVDEFRFSGAVPGYFFDPVIADYYVDNISVTVPEPGSISLLLISAVPFVRRRAR